jgi:multisubunit Na+/H+ antiporter MnhC subunit
LHRPFDKLKAQHERLGTSINCGFRIIAWLFGLLTLITLVSGVAVFVKIRLLKMVIAVGFISIGFISIVRIIGSVERLNAAIQVSKVKE